ncbi:MAG: peptidoglycan DD-metalloendopeptidase family protein [Armatimonadetes bacterium]|nr:peptidoglycan DD-metalloendopeptidase family protein [Armatimonadota bacterium]NCP31266.1 peptidoglycan DD-metalloendopeptidase family protein [Armatimonadota bacterium]NDK14230.1 peptidoglycan DD-metalloendopeptidase family protein [Armatimonadota bacterium]
MPVAALLLGLCPPDSHALRLSLSDLFKRRHTKKAQKVRVREKLRDLKRQQRTAADDLQEAESALDRAERDLRSIGRSLAATEGRLAKARTELAKVEQRLNRHTEVLGGRLRAIYKNGSLGYLELLFSSASFPEFARRTYLFQTIIHRDTDLLHEIKGEKTEVERRKAELTAQREKLQGLKAQHAIRAAAVERQKDRRRDALTRITAERRRYEREMDELLAESRVVESEIRRLTRPRTGSPAVTPWRGGFIRPLSGRVTSGFGYRVHPIYHVRKLHTGVDLAASFGTPIKAAAGGVVLAAGWRRGYGNAVIIDHGGGKATLYGHCSSLSVHAGQKVSQGQIVGRVGSTGNSTGPHLHFEVRINGTPVNPLSF